MLLLVLELARCSHFRMALGRMIPQLPPQLAHPLLRCQVLNNMVGPLLRSGLAVFWPRPFQRCKTRGPIALI